MRFGHFAALLLVAVMVVPAQADITGFNFASVDNSGGGEFIEGHTTTDISIDGTGQLTGVQMLLELTAGSIYQDEVGAATPPNPLLFGTFPALEFDTFIGLGGRTSDTAIEPVRPGGAVNLPGGSDEETFSESKLDITWAPPGANPVNDPTDYFVGRVSLSNDAQGSLLLLGAGDPETPNLLMDDLSIVDGQIMEGEVLDPLAIGDPPSGSDLTAALQDAFDNRGDGPALVSDAIMVMNENGELSELGEITPVVSRGDTLDAISVDLVPGSADGKFSLLMDGDFSSVPRGAMVMGDILVQTEFGGDLDYSFSAKVPEPSTMALAGLGLVGLVGLARRRK